jgi:bacteriocin-like protein
MREKKEMRELTEKELQSVAGGVHLGGVLDRLAQYLWSRTLPR